MKFDTEMRQKGDVSLVNREKAPVCAEFRFVSKGGNSSPKMPIPHLKSGNGYHFYHRQEAA
jgi:hypothetical protein